MAHIDPLSLARLAMWLAGCKIEQGNAAKNIVSLASNLARMRDVGLTLLGVPDWDAGVSLAPAPRPRNPSTRATMAALILFED